MPIIALSPAAPIAAAVDAEAPKNSAADAIEALIGSCTIELVGGCPGRGVHVVIESRSYPPSFRVIYPTNGEAGDVRPGAGGWTTGRYGALGTGFTFGSVIGSDAGFVFCITFAGSLGGIGP